MNRFRKFAVTSLLAALALTGVAAPSHAAGNPDVELWLSSQQPDVGDAVAIYAQIYGCATIPTDITVSLYPGYGNAPVATLTKNTSGFKSRTVRGDIQLQWLYRGPTGDGVDNKVMFLNLNATGGCVVNSQTFHAETMWDPTNNMISPNNLGPRVVPIDNGLRVLWTAPWLSSDPVDFYEVQYAVANTNQWSRSFITHDVRYEIRGLSQGVVYDVRVRATNRIGTGDWAVVDSSYAQSTLRTPAAFSTWVQDSTSARRNAFSANETVTVHMHLTNCDFQPPTGNQWGGSLSWTLFPTVYGVGDGQNARNGTAESAQNSVFTYDTQAKTYDVTFDVTGLSAGTYTLSSYFFGTGCSYPLTPVPAEGLPQGSIADFTVGDYAPAVPFWGTAAAPSSSDVQFVTLSTRNGATVNWTPPKNVLDGPFTYAVYLVKFMSQPVFLGTTARTSYTIAGLSANTSYEVQVRALNSLQPNRDVAPSESTYFRTRAVVVSKKSKTTAATLATMIGLSIPKGATVTITKSKDKFAFGDCTVTKNVLQAAGAVGACTVDLVITPKQVGKKKPTPIKSSYDVIIKN